MFRAAKVLDEVCRDEGPARLVKEEHFSECTTLERDGAEGATPGWIELVAQDRIEGEILSLLRDARRQ
jgi:hypothetical protein